MLGCKNKCCADPPVSVDNLDAVNGVTDPDVDFIAANDAFGPVFVEATVVKEFLTVEYVSFWPAGRLVS